MAYSLICFVDETLERILLRTVGIKSSAELTSSETNRRLLNYLRIELAAIGETIKYIHKITHEGLFCKYPELNMQKVMDMSTISINHQDDVDGEIIFKMIKTDIPQLAVAMKKIRKKLENRGGRVFC